MLFIHIPRQKPEQLGQRKGLLCPIYIEKILKLNFLLHLEIYRKQHNNKFEM